MGNSTSAVETERKYDGSVRKRSGKLTGVLGDIVRGEPRVDQLTAVYYDTGSLALLRGRITLRRREGGHDAGWHLKLPAGTDSRQEIRFPLGNADDGPPEELRSLVRVHTRGDELVPVVRLETERRAWVLSKDGRELLELVEDDVTAHTLGAAPTSRSWSEIEVELAEHGTVKLLDRVERDLARMDVHRAGHGSKLARALEDQRPPEATPKTKPGSAGEALLRYLRAQVEALRAYDPLVRRDEPDAVHQMRATSRRLRSALQAYRRVLRREATEPLVAELKWLGGELADARDYEVLLERLTDTVRELPDELVLGGVQAHLIRTLGRRHADGQRRAIEALDSERYLGLQDMLDTLLADPPWTDRARRPAAKELPKAVGKAWRRADGRFAAACDRAGVAEEEALHEARKAGKRLRYAIEVAEPVVGKPAKRMRRRLKRALSHLGVHQDAVTARPVLRELAVRAHLEGGNGYTYGVLHGAEQLRAHQARQAVAGAWQDVRRGRQLSWL
jgi:CHAD domain-containing protein